MQIDEDNNNLSPKGSVINRANPILDISHVLIRVRFLCQYGQAFFATRFQ